MAFSLGTCAKNGKMAVSARCCDPSSGQLGHLRATWAHLGAILGHLGAIFAQLGPILASSWASREARNLQKPAFSAGFWAFLLNEFLRFNMNYLAPCWVILGSLGSLGGPSWVHLGPSWGHLGIILGHLGRFWAYLGSSWGHLGRLWGLLWPSRALF